MLGLFRKRRIYMDYAAGTPLDPRVVRKLSQAAEEFFGNPSAPHAEGRAARAAIDAARFEVARSLSVKPEELVFTSGGTEANNIAILGVMRALRARKAPAPLHLVTSSIEHSSVMATVALLEKEGVRVTYVAPDKEGIIRPEKVREALTPETALVTLAHVNSETGVIQPVSEIRAALAGEKSTLSRFAPETTFPIFHVDAAQSPLYLDASPHALHADMVSYDAQKMLGPKGAGVLYRDFSVPIAPVFGGGSQERSIRPGTENTPAIVASAFAFTYAKENRHAREKKVRAVRDYLITLVQKEIPDAILIGSAKHRIANNALFAIPDVDGDYLAVLMDKEGVAVTPRSACLGSGGAISEVVMAITGDEAKAKGTIRFSVGPGTSERDCEIAAAALKKSISLCRNRATLV